MNKSKIKGKKQKVNIKLIVLTIIVIIFIVCFLYNIISLFINPTDTFMIENGQISTTEETVRVYNKRRTVISRKKL